MNGDELEYPDKAESLYLASNSHDVVLSRPFMTGDIFDGVKIPGLPDTGLGIVLTHPCSMRVDGVTLAERLLMARVTKWQKLRLTDWAKGHTRVMPLPGLRDQHHAAHFADIGLVASKALTELERVACLTPIGVNLLQQRFIIYMTRFGVATHKLSELTTPVFDEVDLQEEWVEMVAVSGTTYKDAAQTFHTWIRGKDKTGAMRQAQLRDPQRRAGVRREMKKHLSSSEKGCS